MDDWQKKIMRENKAKLLELIDVNIKIVAALESKGLISPDDAETLKNPFLGKSTHRDLLLALIVKKDKTDDDLQMPAFDYFIQLLREETQSGAANLLQQKKDDYLRQQTAMSSSRGPTTKSSSLNEKMKNESVYDAEVERLKVECVRMVKDKLQESFRS